MSNPSIRQRLTIALGLIAVAVFAVVGGVLYWALAVELERSDRAQLAGKVEIVRHLIGETSVSGDMTDLKHHIDDILIGHGELQVWLQAADSTVVLGTEPRPTVTDRVGTVLMLVRSDGGPMEGVEASVGNAGALPVASMLVAIDIRPRLRLLATYRWVLWIACGLGVLASISLAAWATHRGLRSVHRLSAEAAAISSTSLSLRLRSGGVDAELQEMVRAFNAALDRVEAAYRQMETFNADVAHELRTPLATLINAAQVTLTTVRTAEELHENLGHQLEALEEIKGLVNDMLFLARADGGERAADTGPASLAAEATKTINYYEAALAEAGLTASVEGDAQLPGDARLMRRAMSNLLSNAIKHTPRGGHIRLRSGMKDGQGCFEVINPGAPIAGDVQSRMFDRFFRADDARTHPSESFGLGLAIVKAVATMHQGRVYVQSDAQGNAVGMQIPAQQGKAVFRS